MKFYNVNAETRMGVVEVPVEHEVPLEEFISNLRDAAVGLSDPSIEVNVEDDYDIHTVEVCVSGERALTDVEVAAWMKRFRPSPVDRMEALANSMTPEERRAFIERLKS